MNKANFALQAPGCFLLILLLTFTHPFNLSGVLSAQGCSPNAIEIPNNQIDEDCDGLDDIFLHMPPHIYCVTGQEFELYFRNTILSTHPQDYRFVVNTPVGGTSNLEKWVFTANASQIGEFPITLTVSSPSGQQLKSANSVIRITPAGSVPNMTPKKLMLWGHSFIDQGYMPYHLDSILSNGTNPPVTFHGKQGNWIDGYKTRFEAIGGSSWLLYYNSPNSPFFYNGQLNMRAYFDQVCGVGQVPDWIVIHLDVNDYLFVGVLDAMTLQSVDNYIDQIYSTRTAPMLAALRAAAPNAKIAITYTPMPNARQSAFTNTFGATSILSNKYRWQKIVSRLLFKNSQFFAGRENENIYLLPVHLDLDDLNDYGTTDPVHPVVDVANKNAPRSGYREIAKSTYAWLKYIQNPSGTPPICSISSAVPTQAQCNNNGTISDPTDDTFTFNLTVTAQNGSGSWTTSVRGTQITGSYGVPRTFGPYPISGGAVQFIVSDRSLAGCNLPVNIVPPVTCSNGVPQSTCNGNLLQNPGFENGTASWNGPGTIVNDAVEGNSAIRVCGNSYTNMRQTFVGQPFKNYTLKVFAKRQGVSNGRDPYAHVKFLTSSFGLIDVKTVPVTSSSYQLYELPVTSPAYTGYIEVALVVDSGTDCITADQVCFAETTTSPTCSISATASQILCNNNNTPANPSDDTYTFSLNVTGTGTGTGGWNTTFLGNTVTGSYGTPRSFGPTPIISGGNQTLTVRDATNSSCTTTVQVTPPATCSNATSCSISANANQITCNDNGTPTNSADDTYTFNLNVTGTGTGTGGWNTTFLGNTVTGSFGTPRSFGPAAISVGNQTLTVRDASNSTCTTTIQITPPAPCSNGNQTGTCTSNLLRNAGFESNLLDWTTTGATVVSDANTGTKAMKLCGSTFTSIHQTVAASVSGNYELSVMAKRENSTATRFPVLQIKAMNNGWNPLQTRQIDITATSYTKHTINLTLPANTAYVEAMIYVDGSTGCVIADDFCLSTGGNGGPGGNPPAYCANSAASPWQEWISSVKVNSAPARVSGKNNYTDFTSTNFNLTRGGSNTLELKSSYSYFTWDPYWKVWIDFNRNGVFEEPAEIVLQARGTAPTPGFEATSTQLGNFTVPTNALSGTTRMRVIMARNGFGSPCAIVADGEVEDYTVTIGNVALQSGQAAPQSLSLAQMTVYPNPASQMATLYLGEEALNQAVDVQLIRPSANVVRHISRNQLYTDALELDLAHLPSGVYMLHVRVGDNRPAVRKLVIVNE